MFKTNFYSSIITTLILFGLFIINYLFAENEQELNKYYYYFMIISISVFSLLYFANNKNQLLLSLYRVLQMIVAHSLFNFIMFFFIKDNLAVISSTYHECETFLNLFFYTTERGILTFLNIDICRNQGLFWEPGVLQVFLNIYFFLEAFIFKKSKFILVLASIAIVTTYSTTGIGLLIIQSLVYIQQELKKSKWFILLFILLTIPIIMLFNLNVEEKFQGEKEFSFQKRFFDLTQPLFIAAEYPLTGIGLDIDQFQAMREEFYFSSDNLKVLRQKIGVASKMNGTDKGSSNSIMFLFASMGFPTAILFLYMFFHQQIINDNKWLLMIIMVISVMSEPLLLRPFFFIFIVSGFTHFFHRITSHKQQLS
ncbi:MAG: hypothetical protein HOH98_03535 [Flavobacteriaceae bacterium]|nr:hypothetical protein [Flavobacteriaceae bacterium]